jgi:steroid delta-isomerase-like uncharacterized protein
VLTNSPTHNHRPIDANRRRIVELIDAWNAHDPARVAACYAADYVGEDVGAPGVQRGPEEIRKITQVYLRAFPDLRVDLDDLIMDGDKAVIVWTWRGTQRGTFMRIPPTHLPVAVRGTTIVEMKAGLIARATRIWDVAGLLRAIGLLPEL